MKTENKGFFESEVFIERVTEAMRIRGLNYDQLCDLLNDNVGYSVTRSNLKIYINQRTPNIQFAIALSRALGVSLDFLFGNDDEERELIKGINHQLNSNRYKKYLGEHYIYFYNTVSNEPKEIKPSRLNIKFTTKYEVTMFIDTTEGDTKKYEGNFLISDVSPNVFITLHADFGEVVSMAFYDESINFSKFKCALGAMLSISSGDLKRAPVMNRFILTDYEIPEDKMDFVYAHLRLNTKFINISPNVLDKSIKKALPDSEKADSIIERIRNAFSVREYLSIEESYIINTIKRDFELSFEEAEKIIADLRIHSLASINSKINRSLDTKIFECTSK